jgi:flagellar biosynthesis protein
MKRRDRMPVYRAAVALSFAIGRDEAPLVSASGEYYCADTIVEIAQELGVEVVEQEELADSLMEVDVDESIPRELFAVVAELLREVSARLLSRVGQ